MSRPVHTYSIVARDPETGALGVAVQSPYLAVGSIVPWAQAGVGAVATQSFARLDYGPLGLELLERGLTAPQALGVLLEHDPEPERRQVAMIDAHGNVAVHTGASCIVAAGHLVGDGVAVQANHMEDDTVWPAMKSAYEAARGDLADRLLAALDGAQVASGDVRVQRSAALLIVGSEPSTRRWEGVLFDLRVDDHPAPLAELRRLVGLRRAYQHYDLATTHLLEGRFAEAADELAQARVHAPDLPELAFYEAVALFRAGDQATALDRFRAVFDQSPYYVDLVPRLTTLGFVPNDPDTIALITEQGPAG